MASGIAGYTENLRLFHGEFQAARDRIRDDWHIPTESKPKALEEARAAFTRNAAGLVRHVLGEPAPGGLTGGVLWEHIERCQAELRRAYDKADATTDYVRLSYERARLPAVLSQYETTGQLEAALPTMGIYVRRALADAPDAIRARFPAETASIGHIIAGLQRERDAVAERATAATRAALEDLVSDGVSFVQAARNAAIDTDQGADHLGAVLRHVSVREIVDPNPHGGGVRYELSRRDAAPIDTTGAMTFGGEPPSQ